MNSVKRLSLVAGFFALWTGASMAADGVIRFEGRVVEPGCQSSSRGGSTLELTGCPQKLRDSQLNVQPIRSVQAVGTAPVQVKLLTDSGAGRYYDQRYQLVDGRGKPIQSGAYVVTLIAP